MMSDTALSGADLILLHVKQKLSAGLSLTSTEKLGAMSATFAELRSRYGPGPADSQPVDIPLPETVKGAIANARI